MTIEARPCDPILDAVNVEDAPGIKAPGDVGQGFDAEFTVNAASGADFAYRDEAGGVSLPVRL